MVDLKSIEGKTIKKVKDGYFDGLLIKFTDGKVICLSQSTFPDDSYNNSSIEFVDKEDEHIKKAMED